MFIQAEFPMFGGRVGCSGSFDCDKNAVSAGRPFSRPLPHPLSSRPLRIHASAARRQVYFEEWRSTIMRLRNFPCVFDYTMTNEGPLLNHQFAMQLYNTAKTLDPGRLVSTSVIRTRIPEHLGSVAQEDSCGHTGRHRRRRHVQPFQPVRLSHARLRGRGDAAGQQPLVSAGQCVRPPVPSGLPVLGPAARQPRDGQRRSLSRCRASDPSLVSAIPRLQSASLGTGGAFSRRVARRCREHGAMKPWWLSPIRDSLASRGLLGNGSAQDSGALWAARSNKMYVFAWKDRMEAMRKTEALSGYEWWLLQDCPWHPRALAPLAPLSPRDGTVTSHRQGRVVSCARRLAERQRDSRRPLRTQVRQRIDGNDPTPQRWPPTARRAGGRQSPDR